MSKEVFFLGAGFSKYLDSSYPSLADLTKKFKPKNKNFGDIEQYLTYLVSKLPFKDEATIYENLAEYKELTTKIAKYFWNLGDKKLYPIRITIGNNKIKIFKIILDRKIPCITMNYDLLLEYYLLKEKRQEDKFKNINVDSFYKFPIQYMQEALTSDSSSGLNFYSPADLLKQALPEILKLHGSINWYYNGVSANDTIYLYEKTNNKNVDNFRDNLSNFIIPPTLDKQSLYNHIAITHLWKQAYKYLANAEKIYIFGYSFPKSDISVDTLFRSALANNPNNYKIYIFGNSENENPRYKEIFKDKYEYSYGNDENTKRLLEILNNK